MPAVHCTKAPRSSMRTSSSSASVSWRILMGFPSYARNRACALPSPSPFHHVMVKIVPAMRLAVHAKRSTLYGRSNGRKCKFFLLNGLQLFRMIMRLCCVRCELRYYPLNTSYFPKALSPRCEASFDFIKIALLFFSHNSHSVGNELSLTLKLIRRLKSLDSHCFFKKSIVYHIYISF